MADLDSTLNVSIQDEDTSATASVSSDNESLKIEIIGDSGNRADVNASGQLLTTTVGGVSNTKIEGDTSGNVAEVDASNRLLVSTPPPEPPSGTTPVVITEFDDVLGNNRDYNYYTIPNGETVTIQSLIGGSEGTNNESYIALWHDPTGTNASGAEDDGDPSWDIIVLGFTANSNVQFDLNQSFVGDGTARIVLHRRRMDGGQRLMFGRWQGYY